jgi:hypothetical protein
MSQSQRRFESLMLDIPPDDENSFVEDMRPPTTPEHCQ